ncbi:MAG: polyprenyl synthetase family protein [Candidatus Bathyarchaeia archaeon]|jgi:geranylgeranyl pyrophosphate synthase
MSHNREFEVFSEIVERNGRVIMEKAMAEVLDADYDAGKASTAAKYHTRFLSKVAPVFPALVNLAYEVAGRGTQKPIGVGAALTLFVEAANVHDDIIDQSEIKYNRKTVYGKFGREISILAGDILLVQGAFTLYRECEGLPFEQREKIVQLTFGSLAEISKSAAREALMHRRFDILPKDYLEVVRLRAAVPEIHCRVGAILGGGTNEIVEVLGLYGRNYGIIGTILDEFLDMFDYEKFNNRLSKECLPLPILCVLQNNEIKDKILPSIKEYQVNRPDYERIIQLVMSSNEVKTLKDEQIKHVDKTFKQLHNSIENNAEKDLRNLLSIFRSLTCKVDEFTSQFLV